MPLENFRLLASICGKSAVILKVQFQELRMAGESRWQALVVVPHDGQMRFSSIQGKPRIWLSLDKRSLSSRQPSL